MISSQLVFHPKAEIDLDDATKWYHERSEDSRNKFEIEVKKKINLIQNNPDAILKNTGITEKQ